MVDAWLTAEGDDHEAGMERFAQAMFVHSDSDEEGEDRLKQDHTLGHQVATVPSGMHDLEDEVRVLFDLLDDCMLCMRA